MVSVIIPVHNEQRVIERALLSARAQAIPMEVIVIDDFSTDRTAEIIAKFQTEYNSPNFKIDYWHLKYSRPELTRCTGAPNISRNEGVKLAKGEYIAFLDADDQWVKGKLARQIGFMQAMNCRFSTTGTEIIGDGVKNYNTGWGIYYVEMEGLRKFISRDRSLRINISSFIMERSAYVPMDELLGLTDPLWVYKLLEKNHRLAICDEPLTIREEYPGNTSNNKILRFMVFLDQAQILMASLFRYPEYGKDIRIGGERYIKTMARYLYAKEIYPMARIFFLMDKNLKAFLYIMTSFIPPVARWISKNFKVWSN